MLALTLVTLLGAGGGYAVLVHRTPLPDLAVTVDADSEVLAPSGGESEPELPELPTAVGWLDEERVWSNEDQPRELASLTKLITVLVALDARPLEANAEGPRYTVTAEDEQIRQRVADDDGVAFEAPEGLQLSTRQLLELIMLPSANNYAISYAHWVFGSDAGFRKAVAAWAEKHGFDSVSVVEPSGLSRKNVASPTDLVRIARLALEHPALASVIAEPWATIPGIGPVQNSNPLITEPGVIGVKTGTTVTAGRNLIGARTVTIGGRELTGIVVTMGRASEEARAGDTREELHALDALVGTQTVPEPGAPFGSLTTWQGERVSLVADRGASISLRAGERVELSPIAGPVRAGARGQVAGMLTVTAPSGEEQIPLVTDREIVAPDLLWRMLHPAVVFGWDRPGDADERPEASRALPRPTLSGSVGGDAAGPRAGAVSATLVE